MYMEPSRLPYLLQQYASGQLEEKEWQELAAFAEAAGTVMDGDEWEALLSAAGQLTEEHPAEVKDWQPLLKNVFAIDKPAVTDNHVFPIRRRMNWIKYAAAAVLVISVGTVALIIFRIKRNW